ncbi:MAG TPA: M14 family metallopeptidase [Pyrinomonadaceae bacterium]|nr:M14 family metallopeptidase [Pyrinomonadaceae bacterium]
MRINLSQKLSASLRLCVSIFLFAFAAAAQIPAPKDVLGFTPGDDRKLASWAKVIEYFKMLDAASDRVKFEEIGKTTMGAPFVYATISSPENLKNLEKYKQINAQLADPRTIKKIRLRNGREMAPDLVAQMLAAQGKTIVLITCGVHSTEVGSTLSSMLIAQRLAGANDAETKKILDNTIILLVPSLNPDGVDIVKNWYDKTLGTPFEGTEPPELYHKYVGHDDNRDWYAFTQVETQLTVDKIHNVWHPQIVHDIHQQGAFGSRLFLPPYMAPVEPNVPKQIVEGYTELGNYMADSMRSVGYQGITTNSTYDAWTPARAYSHYHGGVRILSETASARLATPITVNFDQLRGSEGYDAKKESANFGPVWRGGEWNLRKITDHMTTAANALLFHAASNREKWLTRFYEIGKEAVRPRKDGELYGFNLKVNSINGESIKDILRRGGVEVIDTKAFKLDGRNSKFSYASEAFVPMNQPYGDFAKALLEEQKYPDLKDEKGNPIPPYDVTAHSLNLLMNIEATPIYSPKSIKHLSTISLPILGKRLPSGVIGIYKSAVPSMDRGWTEWLLSQHVFSPEEGINTKLFVDAEFRSANFTGKAFVNGYDEMGKYSSGEKEVKAKTIIFPDQPANQILNGYAKGSMPDEYTGGVGKEGVENLKKFVEAGGTLVFMNRSSNFAIEQFNLPVKDVTRGLARKDFYIPGSILRTELRSDHPITKGMPKESIAWFESGPVFDYVLNRDKPSQVVVDGSVVKPESSGFDNMQVRFIATYPNDPSKILLSGWALGAEKIAGKAALVEIKAGKGKIILFGFRPQYRGQSLATFPLLFNAISH